eukprot:TRINITY_DN1906_c0_g1_i1.p1 TRINITY_DN1906_c0_g1~~TRINITY_DN1906_c0_g1_i1.p1  ORF type:complete len:417 (-),score=117.03 TRINITY_DN1906_c0_g1_i1:34-1179(-)
MNSEWLQNLRNATGEWTNVQTPVRSSLESLTLFMDKQAKYIKKLEHRITEMEGTINLLERNQRICVEEERFVELNKQVCRQNENIIQLVSSIDNYVTKDKLNKILGNYLTHLEFEQLNSNLVYKEHLKDYLTIKEIKDAIDLHFESNIKPINELVTNHVVACSKFDEIRSDISELQEITSSLNNNQNKMYPSIEALEESKDDLKLSIASLVDASETMNDRITELNERFVDYSDSTTDIIESKADRTLTYKLMDNKFGTFDEKISSFQNNVSSLMETLTNQLETHIRSPHLNNIEISNQINKENTKLALRCNQFDSEMKDVMNCAEQLIVIVGELQDSLKNNAFSMENIKQDVQNVKERYVRLEGLKLFEQRLTQLENTFRK